MAVFVGTNKEFRRYIGPRLRNLVQQQTKTYKAKTGMCQHCGSTSALESAHVKGQDRNQIIDQTLVGQYSENVVTVRLDLFEEKFKEAHDPIEKSILILCRSCHANYDSTVSASMQQTSVSVTDNSYQDHLCDSHLLPITMEPSNSGAFKSERLKLRKSEIQNGDEKMDGNTLIRKLNSVAKQVFVEHFALFQKFAKSELTRDECIERLVSLNVSNENGAAIRCGNAKQIFDNETEYEALLIVISSSRLNQVVKGQALKLIQDRDK